MLYHMTRDLRSTSRWTPSFLPCPWPPAPFLDSTRPSPDTYLLWRGGGGRPGASWVGYRKMLFTQLYFTFVSSCQGGREGGRPGPVSLGSEAVQPTSWSHVRTAGKALTTPLNPRRDSFRGYEKEGRKEGRKKSEIFDPAALEQGRTKAWGASCTSAFLFFSRFPAAIFVVRMNTRRAQRLK